MKGAEICFWLCAACVVYAYAGYPLLLATLARLRPRPVAPTGRRLSGLQQQVDRLLQQPAYAREELRRRRAVQDAVIAGER